MYFFFHNGLNVLHLASKEGRVGQGVLHRFCNLKEKQSPAYCQLGRAARSCQDPSVNVQTQNGFTPLYMTAQENHGEVVQFYLKLYIQTKFKYPLFDPCYLLILYYFQPTITPLHVTARWEMGNMIDLLLDNGANLEVRKRVGLTPLHCAARSRYDNGVDMMLQRGPQFQLRPTVHMAGDHVDAARNCLHHKAPVKEVTVNYCAPCGRPLWTCESG